MFNKQALKVLAIALFLFWCTEYCAILQITELQYLLLQPELESSNPRPIKSSTALQTVCSRFNIYASGRVALALWRGDGYRKGQQQNQSYYCLSSYIKSIRI